MTEISIWAPGDARVSAEIEEEAQRKRAATLGATGLILGHPVGELQSFHAKTVAIFIAGDSSRVRRVCAAK